MTVSSPPAQVAIIGGGLAGLTAAYRLQQLAGERVEVTLFEAHQRIGGLVGSERIGDCLIELGADSFITNKPAVLRLCEDLGLGGELISTDARFRGAYILHQGRPVPTPRGFNLLVPGDLVALLESPLLSAEGKLRLLRERTIPARTDSADESLAAFTTRRLGAEVLDRIVQPLVGGIYTSDPHKLSLRATLPRFLDMEQRHGSLIAASQNIEIAEERSATGARYGLFASLQRGIQSLVDALEQAVRISGVRLTLGATVTGLRCPAVALNGRDAAAAADPEDCRKERAAARYRLQWQVSPCAGPQSPQTAEFDAVILAVPAFRAAALLSTAIGSTGATDATLTELARELAEIEYASSAILVTGHHESDIAHPLQAFGLVIPHVERRRVLAVSFLHRKFVGRAPQGTAILRTFVGGALQPELLDLDDDALTALVREELRDLLGVSGEPLFVRVARYPRAMPQYHLGHLDRVARIEQLTQSLSGLCLAGNAFHGVGLPDTVQSALHAATAIAAHISGTNS